jgi:hypothetical protein
VRFTITEPCVIEVDGVVTFRPIEAPVVNKMDDFIESMFPPSLPVKHRKAPRGRHTLQCRNCGISFRGRSNQMFHEPACKQAFYKRMSRQHAEPLTVHAGASGVETSAG